MRRRTIGAFLRKMTKMILLMIGTIFLMSLVHRSDERQLNPPPPVSAFQEEEHSRNYFAQEENSNLDENR